MRPEVKFLLTLAFAVAAYFAVYFLAADYIGVGFGNGPTYSLRYRIGPCSLDSLAPIFEPARRIDERFFRRRYTIGYSVPGRTDAMIFVPLAGSQAIHA